MRTYIHRYLCSYCHHTNARLVLNGPAAIHCINQSDLLILMYLNFKKRQVLDNK